MAQTLEDRVAIIEAELKQLRREQQHAYPPRLEGWRNLLGTFDNDPAFEEITRLGKAYRDAQIPNYDEPPAA